MISCRARWWPWTKPVYITMTRIQGNNQWSGGIATHSNSKNSECKNPLEKFSPRFFGMKTASSSLIIFQRAKLSTRSITSSLLVQLKDIFKEKTPREGHQGVLPSNVLITHPILRMWPHRTTACSLDWKKKQLKGRNFSSDAKVIAAAKTLLDGQPSEFFFFFQWRAKLRATG